MRVFAGTVQQFRHQLYTNELFQTLDRTYPRVVGHTAGSSERNSWRASLPRLEHALRLVDVAGGACIALEERVPGRPSLPRGGVLPTSGGRTLVFGGLK